MRAPDNRNYIQQGQDTSCQLVALLNAFIYKFEQSPIEYGSKEYRMLVEIGRGVAGPILSMKEIFTLLGVFTQVPPAVCDLRGWIESSLRNEHPVSFPIISPRVGQHQTLIVGSRYAPDMMRLFTLINPQYSNMYSEREDMLWHELASVQSFTSASGLYSICWHDEQGVTRRLKHPQTYEQAVREYHHALKLTGYFPKPVKQEVKKKKRSKRRG